MDAWSIILIVFSILFFGVVFLTKSTKTTYHPKIRGPRGKLPGRDVMTPKDSNPPSKTPPAT